MSSEQQAKQSSLSRQVDPAETFLPAFLQKDSSEVRRQDQTTEVDEAANNTTGGGSYESSSDEMDDELKMLDSREFSPIKPNDADSTEQASPHATMYSSAVSQNQEMYSKENLNFDSVDSKSKEEANAQRAPQHSAYEMAFEHQEDADALESDGELLDLEDLPETVTVLKSKDNKTVYLIGTSHFSKQSHRDVRRVIRTVQPNVVMLELCRSRMCFLTMGESEIMSEAKSLDFSKIRDYIKRNGFVQGFIYTLLLTASAKVTNDLDMAPGGEFRNAFNEALKIPNCSVILGDRPVDITLRRAISTLSTWQKIKMTYNCLFTSEKLDEKELERYKQKDVLEQLIGELSEEFPGLSKVMVDERDLYLAHSLYSVVLTSKPGANIVGVVGIGHSAGIKAHWDTAENINVSELVTIPTHKPSKVMFVIKYSFYGLVGYGVYRYVLPKAAKGFIANAAGQVAAKVSGVFSR